MDNTTEEKGMTRVDSGPTATEIGEKKEKDGASVHVRSHSQTMTFFEHCLIGPRAGPRSRSGRDEPSTTYTATDSAPGSRWYRRSCLVRRYVRGPEMQ